MCMRRCYGQSTSLHRFARIYRQHDTSSEPDVHLSFCENILWLATSYSVVCLNIYTPTKSNRSDESWLSIDDISRYANASIDAAKLSP